MTDWYIQYCTLYSNLQKRLHHPGGSGRVPLMQHFLHPQVHAGQQELANNGLPSCPTLSDAQHSDFQSHRLRHLDRNTSDIGICQSVLFRPNELTGQLRHSQGASDVLALQRLAATLDRSLVYELELPRTVSILMP